METKTPALLRCQQFATSNKKGKTVCAGVEKISGKDQFRCRQTISTFRNSWRLAIYSHHNPRNSNSLFAPAADAFHSLQMHGAPCHDKNQKPILLMQIEFLNKHLSCQKGKGEYQKA
jgi:hypothetical protein